MMDLTVYALNREVNIKPDQKPTFLYSIAFSSDNMQLDAFSKYKNYIALWIYM